MNLREIQALEKLRAEDADPEAWARASAQLNRELRDHIRREEARKSTTEEADSEDR